MGQATENHSIVLSDPGAALDSTPDRLYWLLYDHQLAYKRNRFYYCWESARIYNQYKGLGKDMLAEYYRTLAQVRSDLASGRKPGESFNQGSRYR
jgi:hypothetical protein